MKGGESCLDEVSAPGSTVPGTEKPPMERRVANVPVAKARQRREALDRWLRRTALHSLASARDGRDARRASPGPPVKNTGGGALAKAV
jgi:hypothetical protein